MLRTSLWLVRTGTGVFLKVSLCSVFFVFNLSFHFYYLFFSFLLKLKIHSLNISSWARSVIVERVCDLWASD